MFKGSPRRRFWFTLPVLLSFLLLLAACGEAALENPTEIAAPTLGNILQTTSGVKPVLVVKTTAPVAVTTTQPTPVPATEGKFYQAELAGVPVQIYIPSGLTPSQPAQVLVALHGMKSNGPSITQGLPGYAEQYRWIMLAPTFNYNNDWQNPSVITEEDPMLANKINEIVQEAAVFTGFSFNPRIMLYGFSRGAQLAHRYALMYPERTLAVTTISAGSYSLPFTQMPDVKVTTNNSTPKGKVLPFPYGVGDMERYTGHPFNVTAFSHIKFWVEVGALDTKPGDVPRAYDSYIGTNRVDRARSFYVSLKQIGANATFTIYPGAGHEITSDMRAQACKFFRSINQLHQNNNPAQ